MGIQRFPNLLRRTVLACRLPSPMAPKSASDCCFLLGFSLRPGVTGSTTTLDVFEAAEFIPSAICAHITARELASPPFEDVYIRASRPGHPEPASNMTTWVNSQFPRPDFHQQVQRHYGLQDPRPPYPRKTMVLACRHPICSMSSRPSWHPSMESA